jgi:hypothetical protein
MIATVIMLIVVEEQDDDGKREDNYDGWEWGCKERGTHYKWL